MTSWDERARAVSFLRGGEKKAACLVDILKRSEPLPIDVKSALIGAISPVPRWRRIGGGPVRAIVSTDSTTGPIDNGSVVELYMRRGRAPKFVQEQDFVTALSPAQRPEASLTNLPWSSAQERNRMRFAMMVGSYIDTDEEFRELLATAFNPVAKSKFGLRVVPRGQRRRGRPTHKKNVLELAALRACHALNERTQPLLICDELLAEADRQGIKPETLLKRRSKHGPTKKG